MKTLLLAACLLTATQSAYAALCSQAPADEPCTPDPGKSTDDAKKAIITLIKTAKAAEPIVNSLEAAYRKVRDDRNATVEQQLQAFEAYRLKKLGQDHLYEKVLQKTAELYHVGPDKKSVTIGAPFDPAIAYAEGLKAVWSPKVTDSGPGVLLSVKVIGSDNKPHYTGARSMNPAISGGIEGLTLEDGRVLITKGMIDLAVAKNNLGILARVISHEAKHFDNLSKNPIDNSGRPTGWDSKAVEERRAYWNDVYYAKVFGLDKATQDALQARYDQQMAAIQSGVYSSRDISPADEAKWKNHYENIQINLEEEYEKLQASVVASRLAEQKLLDEERLTRERAAKEFEERKSRVHREEIDSEALRCGHRMHYDTDNKTMLGFGNFWLNRHHVPFDFPDMKAVFLMTRACQDIEEHPDRPAPAACNAAAPILHERAARGDFAAKLKFLTGTTGWIYSENSECMKNILANADKITDTKSFNDVTSTFQKQLSARRAKEAKRDRERDQREKNDGARDNRRGPIQTDPDRRHYYWDPGCNCRIYVD